MPFIDFAEASDLPEGVTSEVLASEPIQKFIQDRFDTTFEKRFEVEAQGLKSTNEQLKAEKQKLKGYLDELKDVDPKEYARLKELEKNGGDAAKQIGVLEAEKEAIKEAYEEKLAAQAQAADQTLSALHAEQLSNRVAQGVREHNSTYPTVAMQEGMEKWVIQEAQNVWKRGEDGSYTPMNGDRVLTGDSGDVMTYSEWVNSLRKRPEFAGMFKTPSGSGANGGANGSGGQHFNPKDMAGSAEQRRAAIAAKFNLPQ